MQCLIVKCLTSFTKKQQINKQTKNKRKKHGAIGLLSNLRLNTPLSKIPILGDILF